MPLETSYGYCRAVRARGGGFVAGTAPGWPAGSCPGAAGAQARRGLGIIVGALAEAGASAADVVRTRMFVTDAADADAVGAAHGEVFGASPPATSMVVVAGLLDPRWKV